MEIDEAKEKAKDVVDKVVATSRDALGKAGNAVQKWSDISIIKIEIMQLKSRRKNLVSELGKYTAKKFYQEQIQSLDCSDDFVQKFLEQIKAVDDMIQLRQDQLPKKH